MGPVSLSNNPFQVYSPQFREAVQPPRFGMAFATKAQTVADQLFDFLMDENGDTLGERLDSFAERAESLRRAHGDEAYRQGQQRLVQLLLKNQNLWKPPSSEWPESKVELITGVLFLFSPAHAVLADFRSLFEASQVSHIAVKSGEDFFKEGMPKIQGRYPEAAYNAGSWMFYQSLEAARQRTKLFNTLIDRIQKLLDPAFKEEVNLLEMSFDMLVDAQEADPLKRFNERLKIQKENAERAGHPNSFVDACAFFLTRFKPRSEEREAFNTVFTILYKAIQDNRFTCREDLSAAVQALKVQRGFSADA